MSELKSAFYRSRDIMQLCDCGKEAIEKLEKNGIIPKHLKRRKGSREERRWLKSAVDKKLGITDNTLNKDVLREIISEELQFLLSSRVLNNQIMSENS